MIIDTFSIYNEVELAIGRLNHLDAFVDKVVIVESDRAYSGIAKNRVFDEVLARAPNPGKIIHVPIEFPGHDIEPWERERIQRDAIVQAVSPFTDARILVSDADEIVDPVVFERVDAADLRANGPMPISILNCYFHPNYVNVAGPETEVWGPYIGLPSHLRDSGATKIRHAFIGAPFGDRLQRSLRMGGWHFSYMGDQAFYEGKFASMAHREPDVQAAKSLSIREMIGGRRGPFDHRAPGYVWALLDPEHVRVPPSFRRHCLTSLPYDSLFQVAARMENARIDTLSPEQLSTLPRGDLLKALRLRLKRLAKRLGTLPA
ncbi:hypothetical protein [Ramlibacter sp. PS4R-6]|uniref:hypothetical protein n=1 Tax=Ramlibacter sp. PS4R-6 TaxID=3133438 RepID=UPI0030A6B066